MKLIFLKININPPKITIHKNRKGLN